MTDDRGQNSEFGSRNAEGGKGQSAWRMVLRVNAEVSGQMTDNGSGKSECGSGKSECGSEQGELRLRNLVRIKEDGERPENFRFTAFGERLLMTGTMMYSDSGYQ